MKHKGFKTHLVWVMLLVALGLLVACEQDEGSGEASTESTPSAAQEVNTRAVSSGIGTVAAEGEIVPLQSVELSFQIGGEVAEILVQEGARVAAGDPLIRLESTALENGLRQAEAGLAAAEASRDAATTQLAVAESAINRAQAGVRAAEAQLALVQAGPTAAEIAAAESGVAAAEAAIVQAAGNRDAAVNVSDAQVGAALARVAVAQAEVEQLQETYDNIIDACFELPDGEEICPLYGPVEESTRSQLEAARANLAAAELAVDEAQAGATPAEQQLAGSGVGVAVAQRNQAQAQLDLLLAGAREEQIQQAEIGVLQAQLAVDQAQTGVTQAEAAVTQAEAAVTTAQADVEAAQQALARATLTAPIGGTIGRISAEVGELVSPGVPVVRLAGEGGWQVTTTDLTELDIVSVKVGSPAEVRVDAIPGEVIPGVVTDIALVPELVRGDVTYAVDVALEEAGDLPLRWGMTATVDIETE